MLNDTILDQIDEIEFAGIFSEMEVCAAMAAVYEKHATILEQAIQPADFEFFTETLVPGVGYKKDGEDSGTESKETKTETKKTESSSNEKIGGKDLKDETDSKKSKTIWLRKVANFLEKLVSVGIRLIQRMLAHFSKEQVKKIFDAPTKKAKVPSSMVNVAKACINLLIYEYMMSVFIALSAGNNNLYTWCKNTMKRLTDPNLLSDKNMDFIGQLIVKFEENRPALGGANIEYLNILTGLMKKVNESGTHIPELFEIVEDLTHKLKKYKFDVKKLELNKAKESKISSDRLSNINTMLSAIKVCTHEHSKQIIEFLKSIAKLVKDDKEVTIEAVMKDVHAIKTEKQVSKPF